jgi:hypothetical protein
MGVTVGHSDIAMPEIARVNASTPASAILVAAVCLRS